MAARWRELDKATAEGKQKEPFNVLDMSFSVGPLERIFGPGGVQLRTQGSVQITTGIKTTKTDNPALSLQSRRKTFFDFDQKIQATINASAGDRLKFDMTYNTDATFDFDSKNLKLKYEGTEDDIVKSIEAGNVEHDHRLIAHPRQHGAVRHKKHPAVRQTHRHGAGVAAKFRVAVGRHPRGSADHSFQNQRRRV